MHPQVRFLVRILMFLAGGGSFVASIHYSSPLLAFVAFSVLIPLGVWMYRTGHLVLTDSVHDYSYGHHDAHHQPSINPASGLPLVGPGASVDVAGNPIGDDGRRHSSH